MDDGEEGCQVGGVGSGDDDNIDPEEADEGPCVVAAGQDVEGFAEVHP